MLATERNLGRSFNIAHSAIAWFVIHSADVMTKRQVGTYGLPINTMEKCMDLEVWCGVVSCSKSQRHTRQCGGHVVCGREISGLAKTHRGHRRR